MCTELFSEKYNQCEKETLPNFFFRNAEKHPDKRALEWLDLENDKVAGVTYKELFSDVIGLGTALYNRGFREKTIALIGERSYEWVLMFLTMECSNVVVLPLDPNLGCDELVKRLKFADAEVCFADEGHPIFDEESAFDKIELLSLKDVMSMALEGKQSVEDGDHKWIDEPVLENQRAVMIYTSGTGGKMKSAILKQSGFTVERHVWNGLKMQDSKNLITLPLYHIAGIANLHGSLLVGTSAFLSSGLRYLMKEYAYVKPKVGFMVPAQALFLHEVLSGKDKDKAQKMLGGNFKAIRATGAPLPANIRESFRKFDIRVTSDYGMTETTGPVSVSMMKDGKVYSKKGSVGHIIDCLDVIVDNPDENGRGEIVISGQNVFEGYYKDQEETDNILRDGKLYTGDIGYIDEDRFLFIVGRKKNVIILGSGENVIPEEIEKLLYRYDEIEECLVYEKEDKIAAKIYCNEEVPASVIEKEVAAINKNQPTYKQISIIEITHDPLEKTSTGKIRRA